MDGRSVIHKPVIGRFALSCQRAMLRIVNAAPPIKKQARRSMEGFRGGEREFEERV